jgi:GAF domain-containing protein
LSSNASLISLVDADEVQFTFNGRDPYMVPRGTPMCSHVVLLQNDEPLVVLDTLKDWRFKGNKVVTDELSVRFYAGYPLRTETGENVGVFCILDNKPRDEFGEEERKQLKELTDMTYRELQGLVSQKQRQLQDKLQFSVNISGPVIRKRLMDF